MFRNFDTVEEVWDESIVREICRKHDNDGLIKFLAEFKRFIGAEGEMLAFGRGAEALRQILLTAIKPERSTVLVSAFNCGVVGDAVTAAGGRIETYDFASPDGRMDWGRVAERFHAGIAAIVVPHFYGVPTDFRVLIEPARERGVMVIEDCAHTIGGSIGGHTPGTLGDAAIFSFSYDKPVSLGGGGALMLNPRLLSRDPNPLAGLTVEIAEPFSEREELKEFLAYLRARRREIRIKGPILGLLHKRLNFVRSADLIFHSPRAIGNVRGTLGLRQLARLRDCQRTRNARASWIGKSIDGGWYVGPDITPAWLKQRVLFSDVSLAESASRALQRKGLRVGNFNWPKPLQGGNGAGEDMPNADIASRCAIDVPVHQGLGEKEMHLVIDELRSHA